MENIQFGVIMMVLLFVVTAIIGIWMKIAHEIGEKVAKVFMRLYKNIIWMVGKCK
ncbi:hypothetical protein SAMN05192551_1119 [Tindallia magadiensis]|uniref:Uncharacterized protein n=1 Tax=Tindallia magadiensis TaxID=69895 RepID=A0A1I3H097_9FIRM|nr:hypothetical protein [Tindallia magadiensis]SFI29185.1 hypothetical protein SAMN05192551_1119 [Tindallia magadiensis]